MNQKIRDHFKAHDPVLYSVIEKTEWKERKKTNDHFLELVESIISQQLSIKAADTIYSRLQGLFKNGIMTPPALLNVPDEKIREVGLSKAKVTYVKDVAQKIVDKEIDFGKFVELTNEEVIQELVKIKGVGRWTAEMFLMGSLSREDVFSYGDLGIRKAIQKLYKLKKEPTPKQAEKISKKWIPYRTIACRILWQSLELK